MALSIDSTVGEILADEKGKAVLEKHLPELMSMPQRVEWAKTRSPKEIAVVSQSPGMGGGVTDELLKAIAEDLSKI